MDAPVRSAPIWSETHTLGTLFSDRFRFTIPYFQRGYGWQEEHAQRLLTNLTDYAAGVGDLDCYPLGSIIVTWHGPELDAAVADGHQRLLTLSIVIAALRDLENDPARRGRLSAAIASGDGMPRLTTQSWGQAVLRDWVQTGGATLLPQPDTGGEFSPSEEAILENRELIRLALADMAPAQRRQLADFMLDRTFVVVLAVEDEIMARLLFSTINEAGLRTDDVDLLKSRVLGQCSDEIREAARGIWEGLEVRIGRERLDRLLRHISVLKTRNPSHWTDQARAYDCIDSGDADAAARFVLDDLRPHGNTLVTMLRAGTDATAQPGAVKRRLQYLGWVTRHDTWRVSALHWLRRRKLDDPETLTFLKRLEALAWVQMISATEIPRREKRYLAIVDEIDTGRVLETGGALTIAAEESAAARRVLADPNFFKRPYKLFLLLRMNGIYEGDDRVHIAPETTVEHILPQRPPRSSMWRKVIGSTAAEQKLLHALGNLSLLTEVEQNRAGNREFEYKRGVYRESPFVLSRMVGENETWSIDAIEARTQRMIGDFFSDLGIA